MATEQDDSDIPVTGGVFTYGKSKFNDNVPGKFWIRNDAVRQVGCGDEHTALLAESGRIFTFGANDWGQLGLGTTKTSTKPSCVKSLKQERSKLVACGRSHTLVATESGKLYGFGANGENQLGVSNVQSSTDPILVDSLEPRDWKMLAAGTGHSAALTEDGDLYMWGSGGEGQLGLGDDEEVVKPKLLSFDSKVVCVSCGYYHTAVVTAKGELFTFGENENGKLGIGDDLTQAEEPELVSIPDKVVWAACGGSHTVAITAKGKVYTFGDGQQGQLGHGTIILQQSTPMMVDKLKGVVAVAASCGENHTAVVTDKGHLYTFGDGRHGKLGLGEENFANQFMPFKVTRFNKFFVDKVSCGGCHMLVLAHPKVENGEVDSSGDERAEDPLKASFANSLRHRDDIDLSGSISARDRRRQNDKKSPLAPLNRTLPPLTSNKQSLPPLNSTLPTPGKENPLNKGRLPQIHHEEKEKEKQKDKKSKEEESEEEEDEEEDDEGEDSDVSVTPEGESEDEDTLNQTLRFKAKQKSKETEKEGKEKLNKEKGKQEKPKPVPRGKQKVQESEEEDEDEEEDEESEEEEKISKKKVSKSDKSNNNAKNNNKKVEESEEDEEDEDEDEDEEEDKGKVKKKGKVVDSEEDEDEEDSKKKKKAKGKKNENKNANKKSSVSMFGRSKKAVVDDDEEEEEEEDEDEEASNEITVDPLTDNPSKCWEIYKKHQTIEEVKPIPLNTPVYEDKVRFVCVSDTHGKDGRFHWDYPAPAGDVFLHGGDFSKVGEYQSICQLNAYLASLTHKYKFVIAGNHDLTMETGPNGGLFGERGMDLQYRFGLNLDQFHSFMDHHKIKHPKELLYNCEYLEDQESSAFGFRIYGSPWQPYFGDWGFNKDRGKDILEVWNKIPDGIDVLLTHGPPLGHGDLCSGGHRAGCVELLNTIQKRVKPKYHVFGHIHEGHGVTTDGNTTYVNASIMTVSYKPKNPPIIFDLPLPPGVKKEDFPAQKLPASLAKNY